MKIINFSAVLFSIAAFSQTGNVGIGTANPTASLHVKTENEFVLRVEDNINTDFGDYVLTSADTKGTFLKKQTNAFKTAFVIPLPATGTDITTASPNWQSTAVTFEIPNGRWSIVANFLLKCKENISANTNTAIIVKASLADFGSTTPSNDIEGNTIASTMGTGTFEGLFNMPVNKGLLTGSIVINNTGDTKKYTIIANKNYFGENKTCTIGNLGNTVDPQNILYALPLNR